jgi:AcrR family transcriptional regulator
MPEALTKGNADRRERILAEASELFSSQGFASVAVDDIAAQSHVAKGTIYNYFSSKDVLYSEVIATRLLHLISVLRDSCREREDAKLNIRAVSVHLMSFMLKYPAFFRLWKREEGSVCADHSHSLYELRSELHQVLADQLGRGLERREIRHVDPNAAAAHILGAVDGAVYRNVDGSGGPADGNGRPDDASDEREALFEFIWRAIVPMDSA